MVKNIFKKIITGITIPFTLISNANTQENINPNPITSDNNGNYEINYNGKFVNSITQEINLAEANGIFTQNLKNIYIKLNEEQKLYDIEKEVIFFFLRHISQKYFSLPPNRVNNTRDYIISDIAKYNIEKIEIIHFLITHFIDKEIDFILQYLRNNRINGIRDVDIIDSLRLIRNSMNSRANVQRFINNLNTNGEYNNLLLNLEEQFLTFQKKIKETQQNQNSEIENKRAIIKYILDSNENSNFIRLLRRIKNLENIEFVFDNKGNVKLELNVRSLNPNFYSELRKKSEDDLEMLKLLTMFSIIESNFCHNNGISVAGAKSCMQIMKNTFDTFNNSRYTFSNAPEEYFIEIAKKKLYNDLTIISPKIKNGKNKLPVLTNQEIIMLTIMYNAGIGTFTRSSGINSLPRETIDYIFFMLILKNYIELKF